MGELITMAGVEVGFAAPLLPHLLGPWQGVRTQLCSGYLLTQAGLLCAPAPPSQESMTGSVWLFAQRLKLEL